MPGFGKIENQEWQWVILVSAALLICISIPFIWARAVSIPDLQFSGLLNDPVEGAGYLAAMRQGYAGEMTFRPPFTPEMESGAFINIFYLSLGHLARVLNEPLVMVFDAARLAGGLVMLLALYRFIADWTDDHDQRRFTWAFAVLGSGFGFFYFLISGGFSPDLLNLPAAFPLQAVFTNAHYPWAISLQLLLIHVFLKFVLDENEEKISLNLYTIFFALGSLAYASLMPYAWLVTLLASIVVFIALWFERKRFPLRELSFGAVGGIFALPIVAYQFWLFFIDRGIFHQLFLLQLPDPIMPWLLGVSFGLLLLLAIAGVIGNTRYTDTGHLFLITWMAAGLILLTLPIPHGREFALSLVVPIAIFAGIGLWRVILLSLRPRQRIALGVGVVALTLPTTVAAFALPIPAILNLVGTPEDVYFLTDQEVSVLDFLEGASDDTVPLVLADQALSLFIPQVGGRVVYVSPVDTLDPIAREEMVRAFFTGESCAVVDEMGVDYFLLTADEKRWQGERSCLDHGEIVFISADESVILYQTRE